MYILRDCFDHSEYYKSSSWFIMCHELVQFNSNVSYHVPKSRDIIGWNNFVFIGRRLSPCSCNHHAVSNCATDQSAFDRIRSSFDAPFPPLSFFQRRLFESQRRSWNFTVASAYTHIYYTTNWRFIVPWGDKSSFHDNLRFHSVLSVDFPIFRWFPRNLLAS